MTRLLKIGLLVVLIIGFTSIPSVAQERDQMKRSVGPANFYLSIKDKLGITKEQEEKLMSIEKDAFKKLEEISLALIKAQQSLNALTKEEEIDLPKTKELLKSIASLDTDAKYTIIEAVALEKKVLTKEQREKVKDITQGIPKGPEMPPAPPAKK